MTQIDLFREIYEKRNRSLIWLRVEDASLCRLGACLRLGRVLARDSLLGTGQRVCEGGVYFLKTECFSCPPPLQRIRRRNF